MSMSGPITYQPCDIVVTDENTGDPIPGVVVKILSSDGRQQVFGQATTDSTGTASFLLPSPSTYQARFYKFATCFPSPLLVSVQNPTLSSPTPNEFAVTGNVFKYPQATDPRLCLASGFFRTPSGSAAREVDLQFVAHFDPVLLDGTPILTERVDVHTDHRGYVEVNLIRCGIYSLTVSGMEDMYRRIYVPDNAWVNIGDLILPVVESVSFEEGPGPFTIPLNGMLVLHPTVRTSDLRTLEHISSDVRWKSDDPNVMAVTIDCNTLVLYGLMVGTANLEGFRHHHAPIRIPNTPIAGVPVAVTVS